MSVIFSGSKPKTADRLFFPEALSVAFPRTIPIVGLGSNNLLSIDSVSTCVNSGGKLDTRMVEPTS